ncbi:hypothetical protein [Crocosphaera sp. Alani8]|uniref:hypothetical protein n=1 Tax=Crocosphaera sp. Alani8 TaxID=3038952 RepID=UPI00313B2675
MSNLERIESVKAGYLGGMGFTITYVLILAINYSTWDIYVADVIGLGVKVAIAFTSGFLFAVTYRYIIRTDKNSHLKDGAVFAFGLVRGLVPVEMSPDFLDHLGQLTILGLESVICFTITRFCLDFAFERGWIKLFS